MKTRKKFFTLSLLIIILTFTLIVSGMKIFAHDVTDAPWIYINNEAVIEDNSSPNPSVLDWGEHIFETNLKKDSEIDLHIDKSVIIRDFEEKEENISIKINLKLPNGEEKIYTNDFKYTLKDTGNYFVDIALSEKDTKREIVDESVMFIVGDKVNKTGFTVNGSEINIESPAPTFIIDKSAKLSFSILDPNETKYNYNWDFGTGTTKQGTDVNYDFETTKLPLYVVLRTTDKSTNVFEDSYVRIDTKGENTFKIPTPPVKIPNTTSADTTSISPVLIIASGSILLIVTIIAAIVILRKRK